MKKLAPLFAAMAAALVLFFLWSARLWPFDGHPEPEEVALADLTVEHDAVRVTGTAHYPVRVTQERQGRFGHVGGTWYVFPLFDKGDTMSRTIRVIVATPVPIDDLAQYEDMTVEGYALPSPAAMTPSTEDMFQEQGYTFADDYFVVEAWPAP